MCMDVKITADANANEAQQAAIDARESLITVSAGAGTGKTWTLASRYASILTDRNCGCNVENIITLTFTEKAAQEMKKRIESVINEKINSAAENEKVILQGALSRFDDAHILTIHSFASGMLKESALILGLDPASSIISLPQADELTEELGRKIEELDETITGHFKDAASLEKILSKWAPQDIAVLSGECEEIHSALGSSHEEFLQMRHDSVMEKVVEKVKRSSMSRFKSAYEKWHAVLHEISGEIALFLEKKGKISDYVLNFHGLINRWYGKKIEHNDELINFFKDLMGSPLKRANFGSLSETVNLCLGEPAAEWKKRHKDLLAISKNLSVDEIISNYPDDMSEREALIKLCSVCWRVIEERRRENKMLTFADLIKFGSEGIARDPKRNFKQVMVDEFQDTDPLQEQMIRSMGKGSDVNVFVVGDPKQSIYRFRNADLSIFESYVRESVKNKNSVYIKMDKSFRMRSGLYHKINGLFRYIWPENLGATIKGLKYEDLSGDADRERDSGTLPMMAMLIEKQDKRAAKKEPDHDGEASIGGEREVKEKIDEVKKRLLGKLTETILHWKAGGSTVWDSKEKCLRPFEWGDCAVLTQTRASWTLIEDAFSKAGIPLSAEGNVSWFEHTEVTDIVNMLRAIAFPEDELSNTGWRGSFLSPRDKDREDFLRRTGKLKGGAAVLNYFLDNLSWLENIPAPQRLRALANMRYASRLAEDYESLICRSIHGCSEWLSKSLKSGNRFEEPQITDDKCVKLLTVHASKGLEFPFVTIYGTERLPKRKGNTKSLTASKHLGLFASKHELFKTFHYAIEDEAETEEYQRLFYVAATRAKDSILFCGITDEEGNAESGSWLQYLTGWNVKNDIVPVEVINEKLTSSLFAQKENILPVCLLENTSKNVVKLELPARDVSLTRISATSYALFEWCPFAWRRRHRQGIDIDFKKYPDIFDKGDDLSGKDIGSITHWILSRWDYSAEDLDRYLPRGEAGNAVRLLPPSLRAVYRVGANREKIRRWLLNFAYSEMGGQFRRLYFESKLKREVKIKISVAGKIKLTGAFDVFW